ncbi:MAG: glycosyltransferase family 39 protein [bacterium]|nr:glycosyltransferase family 39 protein [bacterium]MDT8365607.1 glycosyltransferase family 39 protein [bacterium]
MSAYLWWIVILAVSWGQGALLLRVLYSEGPKGEREMRPALVIGLGLGALSLEIFLLGLAGFYNTQAITALVLAVLVAVAPVLRKDIVRILPGVTPGVQKFGPGTRIPLILISIAGLVNLLFTLVPPVFFDAMTYHLELPSRYLLEGKVFHVSENLYSGYPQIAEILFGAGMALDGLDLAGMISMTFLLLTILLLWEWGKERFGEAGTAWGIALLVLTPPLMVIAGFFENDWAAAFFTLATLAILAEGDRRPASMVLAGCMAGLATGCKYNALAFALAAPLAAGIWDDLREKRGLHSVPWGIFLLSALVVVSPWYLKNLLFTGDPLYPLLAGFAGKVPGLKILAADTHYHTISIKDIWTWALVPYFAVFKPWSLQFPMSIGRLPVVLLLTLPWLKGSRTGNRFLGTWALLFFVAWYFSFRSGRFLIPLLAVAFLYMGTGFARVLAVDSIWSRLLKAFAVIMLLANVWIFLDFDAGYANRAGIAFGMTKDKEYLSSNYPLYPAINYLNNLDPQPGKVLFLGEMKGFYSNFSREVATFEMPHRLIEMVKDGRTSNEMANELSRAGFTHILFNTWEMKRLAAKSPFLRIDDEAASMLTRFLSDQADIAFEEKGIYVFTLR